jgi:hypothetical protein
MDSLENFRKKYSEVCLELIKKVCELPSTTSTEAEKLELETWMNGKHLEKFASDTYEMVCT